MGHSTKKVEKPQV